MTRTMSLPLLLSVLAVSSSSTSFASAFVSYDQSKTTKTSSIAVFSSLHTCSGSSCTTKCNVLRPHLLSTNRVTRLSNNIRVSPKSLRMSMANDDDGEDEDDDDSFDVDENNPLSRGIDSVSWLPSVNSASSSPIPRRSVIDPATAAVAPVPDGDDQENNTEILPLFPLGGIVYTPNSEHILNIFEPRYRQMYNDILMNGSKRFVVSMCHPNEEGRFAQMGVLFTLEELKEVSGMTADRVKYICNHRVAGRVKIQEVINPEVWESRDTYLKVRGWIIDDTGHLAKSESKQEEEEEDDNNTSGGDEISGMDEKISKSFVTALKKAAMADSIVKTPDEEALYRSFSRLVELQHDLSEDVRFTRASVVSFGVADGTDVDPNLWTSIRLWQSYAEQRLVARQNEMQKEFQERLVDYLRKEMQSGSGDDAKKNGGGAAEELPSAIGFQDLSPELQGELIELQKRMTTELKPLLLEQTLSMQKILEAVDHHERVKLMSYFVEAERKRLQAKKTLKNMFGSGSSLPSVATNKESSSREVLQKKPTPPSQKAQEESASQFFADDGDAFQ